MKILILILASISSLAFASESLCTITTDLRRERNGAYSHSAIVLLNGNSVKDYTGPDNTPGNHRRIDLAKAYIAELVKMGVCLNGEF